MSDLADEELDIALRAEARDEWDGELVLRLAREVQRRRLADWRRGMIVVWPADDLPGIWVSYDCDADVISQGTSQVRAMEAILEAVSMIEKYKAER